MISRLENKIINKYKLRSSAQSKKKKKRKKKKNKKEKKKTCMNRFSLVIENPFIVRFARSGFFSNTAQDNEYLE